MYSIISRSVQSPTYTTHPCGRTFLHTWGAGKVVVVVDGDEVVERCMRAHAGPKRGHREERTMRGRAMWVAGSRARITCEVGEKGVLGGSGAAVST